MAGPFTGTELTAEKFRDAFGLLVTTRYHGAWTMFANTPKGFIPVGMVFAFYSHADPLLSPFMIIGDIVWFSYATPRNKIESAVNFLSRIRKTIPMMDYAHGEENIRFWNMLAQHAIVRRVGTTFNVVHGQQTAIFETRTD